ncbi:MAG: hypothetical protein AB7S26_29145 [Sandaracinaceae bacterium]
MTNTSHDTLSIGPRVLACAFVLLGLPASLVRAQDAQPAPPPFMVLVPEPGPNGQPSAPVIVPAPTSPLPASPLPTSPLPTSPLPTSPLPTSPPAPVRLDDGAVGVPPVDAAPTEAAPQPATSDVAPPSAAPTMTLDVQAAGAVDPEVLRSALEADLGVRVELVQGGARILIERDPDGTLRIRVRRADDEASAIERRTEVDREPARLSIAVSLLVANLVRDESDDVLAMLRVPAPEATVAPTPAPPPEAPAEPVVDERPDPMPFAIDLFPGVGFSSATLAPRAFSLGAVGALHGGVTGFAASSVLDIGMGDIDGAQLAGVLSLGVGELHGFQSAGVASIVSDGADGVQLGGVLAVSGGALHGLSGSGVIAVAGGEVNGAQLTGVAAISGGHVHGFQASGVLAASGGDVDGAQLAGVAAVSGGAVHGLQASVVNVAGAVDGAQLGVINVAGGDIDGLQLGLVNVAGGTVHGLQLGLVNVSERADASVGLVNVNARGRTQLRGGVDTNGIVSAGLVHGGGWSHTVLQAGALLAPERAYGVLGLGFGGRASIADELDLDFDVLGSVLLHEQTAQTGVETLGEARITATVPVFDELGVYFGVAYRVHIASSEAEPIIGAPVLETTFVDDEVRVRGWPALFAGVSLF